MARATDATLKMLGYSETGIPSPMDPPWHRVGHVGGRFTSDVYPLPGSEHGCEIAIGYRAEGWIAHSEQAPKIGAVLRGAGQLRRQQLTQGSYRGLTSAEHQALVDAIRAHPEHRSR